MTDLMAGLATAARCNKPRLFALYGPFHDSTELTVLGWGMDFRAFGRTLYYDPDSGQTHSSDNPDRLVRLYGRVADVRLEWLDPE